MIRVRNEQDFRNWFKQNYQKLRFSKILESSTTSCPDFVMLEGEKEARMELEVKSSNFILHNHSIDDVDKVVCIIEDKKLEVPTQVVEGIRLSDYSEGDSSYSHKNKIYKLFRTNRILVTSEIASMLGISKGAVERNLFELALEGKIDRIKKEGIILWLRK